MAVEIATGTEILGEKIWRNDLKVLYINAEDSRAEINRRVYAFYRAHALKLAGRNLDRLSVVGVDDPRIKSLSFLRVNEKGATILNDAGFGVLETGLEALCPDLLVLDPLVAFCGGGNMNDNAVMALVSREFKRLATRFDCAILILHHTRKGSRGSDPAGEAEEISGASSIVNLARRALTLKPMTEPEAKLLGVLPSEQWQYLKLVDAKSNLAPRSADSPWYRLHSVELPNPEPPIYPHGDSVQAIARVHLPLLSSAAATTDDQKIPDAILDIVARG
jgi:RecA-family ATPase